MYWTVVLIAFVFFNPLHASDENHHHPDEHRPSFKRVFVVVLENLEFWEMNVHPKMNALAKKGLLHTNHKATTHPSQPNYISMIAGDTMGVKDNNDHDIEGRNLVDLLEEKQISWKAYQENYPGNCFSGSKSNKYYRKHNPFISFNTIRNNATRCSKIVNSDQLWTDIDNDALPQFMFYTPNIDNSGHNTGPLGAANWASSFMHTLLPKKGIVDETLVILTFDEGLLIGPNIVFTLLIGPGVTPDTKDNTRYTHYSLLRTIEDIFHLGTLGRKDETAVPFKFAHNPPSFLLNLGMFVGICVAALAALVVSITLFSVCMHRRCKRNKKGVKLDDKNVPLDGAEKDSPQQNRNFSAMTADV